MTALMLNEMAAVQKTTLLLKNVGTAYSYMQLFNWPPGGKVVFLIVWQNGDNMFNNVAACYRKNS